MIGWPQEPEDATVLDPDEREGLIPSHITLRRELNELEQQNILEATSWALARRRDPVDEGFWAPLASPHVRPGVAMGRRIPEL